MNNDMNEMKCTKVPGTPARALMQISTCAYLISTCGIEGRVTLAKMAENSLKF